MKTHTLDKTFSFHDIKNILEFLDKSSRVMHKNISKQINNRLIKINKEKIIATF